jgi:hypothetical protein
LSIPLGPQGGLTRSKALNLVRLASRLDPPVHRVWGFNRNKCASAQLGVARQAALEADHTELRLLPRVKKGPGRGIYAGEGVETRCIFSGVSLRVCLGGLFARALRCIFQVTFEDRQQGFERVAVGSAAFEPNGLDVVRPQHPAEFFGT